MNTVRPPADEPQVLLESGASSQDLAIRELTALTDPGAKGASAGWRRIPVGAEVTARGVNFRVWAPERRQVEVVLAEGLERLTPIALDPEADGYFSATVETARAGTLYWYRLDGEADLLPDPASRFQPEGPMGPSEVIDPDLFAWTDLDWPGVGWNDQVLYEVHVGTFTREGTWRAAIEQLPALAELGITVIEMMPVADFVGRFGWGYDGVDLFAPTRLYGGPDDLRAFIDAAHGVGLGVILDVVYNHLGPSGNVLPLFSEQYFSKRHATDWGDAINFDGAGCEPVRELFVANAAYWIREFHFDGLRVDATQNIYDSDPSHDHILAAITHAAREAAGKRSVFIVAENEPQDVTLVKSPREGGYGMDAMWNDDLHHTAAVALTGRKEAYYTDYRGTPQEFVSAAKYGFLYQGQRYKWQRKPRGTPTFGIHPERFVAFIQNHDQVANTGLGQRVNELAGSPRCRAMTAYILLAPGTPMLFMGEEFAASSPFLYFADHEQELTDLVHDGRKEFLQQFRSLATPEMQDAFPRPDDPETFERCKLDFSEREAHAGTHELHRDLLRLRRDDPVLRLRRPGGVDGAVLGPGAFVLRFFGEGDDRLLLVNLDAELHLDPAPEPLLAPLPGCTWGILWSSEDPRYGGSGTPAVYTEEENWRLPGRIAIVLRPKPTEEPAVIEDTEPATDRHD
jgi:maltooligosyltrehalose trehalohydrolase